LLAAIAFSSSLEACLLRGPLATLAPKGAAHVNALALAAAQRQLMCQ